MQKNIKISASLLSANFAKLGEEVSDISEAGADYIHIDVMDGFFVPDLTIGPRIVGAIREYSNIPFDVHLMTAPVDNLVPDFLKAGADIITVHYEAVTHLHNILDKIKLYGKKAGVAIVPSTPVSLLEPIIEYIDLLLIMTVNPGASGQSLIKSQLRKIKEAKSLAEKYNQEMEISVDGGINKENVQDIIESGANVIVAGTAIFSDGRNNYRQNIKNLKGKINE